MDKYMNIDGRAVGFSEGETIMEVLRRAGIHLTTFCYQPELKPFGSCRMCMVEVSGRGCMPACSTPAADGMEIRTDSRRLRSLKKIIVELLLASHRESCPTCPKSGSCQLLRAARELGVSETRYKPAAREKCADTTSLSVVRESSRCILCGSCVRVCSEIQGVGALSFAGRGAKAEISAGCGGQLGATACVGCGQCVRVCPVGALSERADSDRAWDAIYDERRLTAVQVAPAVNVALGECFGLGRGVNAAGKIAAALRRLGFDRVYDTAFAADMTVIEEGGEFLERLKTGENLPQLTSCCPAWVKYAEEFLPGMLDNLSSCKSPQQMFGAVCKRELGRAEGLKREDITVVSVMPCTAKKGEAAKARFSECGTPDVDIVLTTRELAGMIKSRGIDLAALEPEEFDLPFGAKTGAGVLFGASGGVSEAVVRYAGHVLGQERVDITAEALPDGVRLLTAQLDGYTVRIAVVSGLGNARRLIGRVRSGEVQCELIEVMACPGGCVSGGGQPVSDDCMKTAALRAGGLRGYDEALGSGSSEQNAGLMALYTGALADREAAHGLLHTTYQPRTAARK